MKYIINVDLEHLNECLDGRADCQSQLHKGYGRHFDLTVHALGCGHLNSRSVVDRPRRYWDRNNGEGYTLQQVVERIQELRMRHSDAYPRRCASCNVEAHLPDWD